MCTLKNFLKTFFLLFYTLNTILKYFICFYKILKTNNWHYNYFSAAYWKIHSTVVITALKEKSQKKKKTALESQCCFLIWHWMCEEVTEK